MLDWSDAATSAVTVVGTLGGIWLGHTLGRRSQRDDRVRDLDRAAISDTREWLSDVLDVISAAASRKWLTVWRLGRRVSNRRYPRQLPALIADESLVEELSTTLPAAIEALPRVPHDLAARPDSMRFLANMAMLEQEKMLEREGKLRLSSEDQHRKLLISAERIQLATDRFRGWRKVRFVAATFLP